MIIDLDGSRVKFLGDVHLGRTFRNGVPLHRRGDREKMVLFQFIQEINSGDFDVLIQVGDLFDKFRVDLNVAVQTAEAIKLVADNTAIKADANQQPTPQFFFIAGNHDLARDTDKISSFELVARLCGSSDNVRFVTQPVLLPWPNVLLLPWHPINSAAEIVAGVDSKVDCAVGHWDHTDIGGEFNLIPLDKLKTLTKLVISGHDHVARSYKSGKTEVVITGSMQPYSHAEDPEGSLYKTNTLAEVEAFVSMDPKYFSNTCLRVLLAEGEELPEDIDCLQITSKRLDKDDEAELDVGFEDGLDVNKLFVECFAEVDPDITAEVKEKWDEVSHA